jgi:maleate isomerase
MSRTRIGMLTPSSNTVLEPMTGAILAGLPDVTAHFSRFKVTEIALSDQALRQFDDTEILRAAELLGHARVDVIAWNGTSASWLGFDRDEQLSARIKETTGIAGCTCVLGFRNVMRRAGVTRVGLVTPYRDDVQAKICVNWAGQGFACTAERHAGLQDNFSFAEMTPEAIADMARAVARDGCDAIAIVCTNMAGARLAVPLEEELGVPIYDSVSVTVFESLCTAGIDPGRVDGWGSLFALGRAV